MKKTRKALSLVLAVIVAMGSMPFIHISTAAEEAVAYALATGTEANPTRPVEASGALNYTDLYKININSQSTSYTFYQTVDDEYFTYGQTQGMQNYYETSVSNRVLTFESIAFYEGESGMDGSTEPKEIEAGSGRWESPLITDNPTGKFLSEYYVSGAWSATNDNASKIGSRPENFVLSGSWADIGGCKVYTWQNDVVFKGNGASVKGEINTGYYEQLKWNWAATDGKSSARFDLRIGTTLRVLDARELAKELAEAQEILENPDDYTEAYISSVEATVNAIPEDLKDFSKVYDQAVIDKYAQELKNVSLNSADYREFNETYQSLEGITNEKGSFTDDSYQSFKEEIERINQELPKNLDKTKQDVVDEATQALKDAYNNILVVKGSASGGVYTETTQDVKFTVQNDFKLIQIKDDQIFSYTQHWTADRRNLESKDSRRMFYSVIDSSSAFTSRFTDSSVDTVSSLSANAIDGSLSNALIFTCWDEVLEDGSQNPSTEVILRESGTIDGSYAGFQKDKVYYIENSPCFKGLSASETGEHTFTFDQKIYLNWQNNYIVYVKDNFSTTSFTTTITVTDARKLVSAVEEAKKTLANPGTHSEGYITALQAAVDSVPVELLRGVKYYTQAEVDKFYNDITTISEEVADYSEFVEVFNMMTSLNSDKYTADSYNAFIDEIYEINQGLAKNLTADNQATVNAAIDALYAAYNKLVSRHLNDDSVFTQDDITETGNNPLEFSISSTQYNFMQIADGQKFAIRTEITARNTKTRYTCNLLALRFSTVSADTVGTVCEGRENPDKGCHNGETVTVNQTEAVLGAVSGVNHYGTANDAGDIGEHNTWVNTEGVALSSNGIFNDPTTLSTSDSSAYAEMYYVGPSGNQESYTGTVDVTLAFRLGWSYHETVLGVDGESIRRHAHIPVNIKITDARALNSLYNEVEEILNGETETDYSLESLESLYSAYNKTPTDMVYGEAFYTQEEVNAAYNALLSPYREIKESADYSEYLKESIKAQEIIKTNNDDGYGNSIYDEDAFTQFKETVEAVNNGLDKSLDATPENQAIIDSATSEIKNALAELEATKYADYKELEEAILEAEKIAGAPEGTYTDATLDKLTEILDDAKSIDKKLSVSEQAEIDSLASSLKAAIEDMEFKADYSEYNEAYERVQDIINNPDKYTNETVKAAENAMNGAGAISKDLPDTAENRETIKNATDELNGVLDGAVERADYSEFNKAYESVEEIANNSTGKYTDSTVQAAKDALEQADELDKNLSKSDENQSLIDNATSKLVEMLAGAEEKADYSEFDKAVEDLESIVNNPDDFTSEAVENAQAALDSVKDIDRDMPSSEQEALDEITNSLRDVISNAEKKADYSDYNDAKAEADNLVNDDGNGNPVYDEDVFNEYKEAVEKIDGELGKDLPESEQTTVDEASQALKDLRTELDATKGREQDIIDSEKTADSIIQDVINESGYSEDEIIIEFNDYAGEKLEGEALVGTGSTMKAVLKSTGEIVAYKLYIVLGDVDGDGDVDSVDYEISESVNLGEATYSEEHNYFFIANDICDDGVIDVLDTFEIVRIMK